MDAQVAIQTLLAKNLAETQSRNPRYSLRAHSQRVGVHVGALSHILNGRRNVSRKLAERIVRRLLLDPQQRSEILALFPPKRSTIRKGFQSDEPRYRELSAAQFKIASEWEHFAVMSLIKCKDAQFEYEWISQRLGITLARATQVTKRLLDLGLIERDSSGRLRRSSKAFRTSDDVADISIQKHHEESLELAKNSLCRDSVSERDMTSITMAIDMKKLGTAKEIIRKFEDDLSELLETGHATEVYRLSVQLFPLSVLRHGDKGDTHEILEK